MTTKKINQDTVFIKRVLSHYDSNGRHDLPWRKRITPYRILISEIMLQQTQVSRVVPKFENWIKAFPTLESLRTGSFLEMLYLWQGLGYQRRAKALFDIAQRTTRLPKSYEELLSIPGVGPYTASALQAFAYDEFPDYLVETNIRTALIEEFHQGETNIHDGVLYDDLARLSNSKAVQERGARVWYYALMDYGAYLKSQKISHNAKSRHYAKQTPFEGSVRKLRAQILFAIAHKERLPEDERVPGVVEKLMKEGYIVKKGPNYSIT